MGINIVSPFVKKLKALLSSEPIPQPLTRVLLTRTKHDGYTAGVMTSKAFSGTLKTLERDYRDNQRGVSCINPGLYRCTYCYMNDAKTNHYKLLDVLNRDGIFIHSGNTVNDSQGCILVGFTQNPLGDLGMSKSAVSFFESSMEKKDFILEIR